MRVMNFTYWKTKNYNLFQTLVFLVDDKRWSNLRSYLIEERIGKNGCGFIFGLLISFICPGILSLQSFLLHFIVHRNIATECENQSFARRFFNKINSVSLSKEYQPVIVTNIFGYRDNYHGAKKDKKVEW